MTRGFKTSLHRFAAVALMIAATMAIALAISPSSALAANNGPTASVSPDGAGTVSADPIEFGVAYTATPNNGYTLSYWTVDGERRNLNPDSPNTLQITLGDGQDYPAVTAVFASADEKQEWDGPRTVEIEVYPGQSGSISVKGYLPTDPGSYLTIPEDSVKLSDPNGAIGSWSFDPKSFSISYKLVDDASKIGSEIRISATIQSEKYYDFEGTVIIRVVSEKPAAIYKITVIDDGNGTAEASVAEAAAGTKVTLTATPKDQSYEFDKWVSEDVTIENDSFVMPEKDVTVKATFKAKSSSDSPGQLAKTGDAAMPAAAGMALALVAASILLVARRKLG